MYQDKNGYRHWDLDDKPWWWKNLEKAWAYNKSKSKKELPIKPEMPRKPVGMRYHSDEYVAWTLQQDYGSQGMRKRKPGRPKLKEEEKVKPKLKRSEQMKKLLQDYGITVKNDNTLDKHPSVIFLPNGRLKAGGFSSSVHQFLKNIDAK